MIPDHEAWWKDGTWAKEEPLNFPAVFSSLWHGLDVGLLGLGGSVRPTECCSSLRIFSGCVHAMWQGSVL